MKRSNFIVLYFVILVIYILIYDLSIYYDRVVVLYYIYKINYWFIIFLGLQGYFCS